METAKIFSNGGSQAVRLPKTCRFNTNEVLVNHIGDVVMLIPKDSRWENLLTSLDLFTDDFLSEKIEALPLNPMIRYMLDTNMIVYATKRNPHREW